MTPSEIDCYHLAVACYSKGDNAGALARLAPLLSRVPADVEALNLAAACAYGSNRKDLAEDYWRRAIDEHPREAGPYSNLGNLFTELDRLDEAQTAYRQALDLRPDFAQAHYNLANVLDQLGRTGEAEQAFRRALDIEPDFAQAHFNLAALLNRLDRLTEAESAYRRALAARPDYAEAHNNLGNLLVSLGRADEAEAHLRLVVAARPEWGDGYYNLGNALREGDRLPEAESAYREALALHPGHAGALDNLGGLLMRLGRGEEAEACYREALARDPSNADKHMNLGFAIYHASIFGPRPRFDEAEHAFRQALSLRPDLIGAHGNLGLVLKEQRGRLAEAEAIFREALRFDPHSASSKVNLAAVLLRTGRYEEGWPLLEARYDANPESVPLGALHWPLPRWRGESLQGKTLFVLAEQGYGDNLQFCRYLPMLKQRGLSKLTMICPPALKPLLETVAGVDACVTPADLEGALHADYWCLLLSLPFLTGTTLETIPASVPYIEARPERVDAWRARLPADLPKVGVVWGGEPRAWAIESTAHFTRRHVDARFLAPVLESPGIAFVSLQQGPVARAQAGGLPARLRPLDLMDDVADFADTAAIIESLDLVITVDTSVAHLAGALGKPAWILLCSNACWRWLEDRDDSPWYPSMRLFRQSQPGRWDDVIDRVTSELSIWRAAQARN
ncbi:tetratricopeptide repeat protein [Caballeronia sp. J97]|uniref:tetratricopeptide repeat protein n=1 Tax=Caballeronia sp. J97 TaxID=2805429 RepID=UPI002AB245E5|nr:tetratricopeptide repeat protein [Caballeronia sp. J97]